MIDLSNVGTVIGKLNLRANGGDGGDGANGSDGKDGADGVDGEERDSYVEPSVYSKVVVIFPTDPAPPGRGTNATYGGFGGEGGRPGAIVLPRDASSAPLLSVSADKGRNGMDGKNGQPGKCGRHGNEAMVNVFTHIPRYFGGADVTRVRGYTSEPDTEQGARRVCGVTDGKYWKEDDTHNIYSNRAYPNLTRGPSGPDDIMVNGQLVRRSDYNGRLAGHQVPMAAAAASTTLDFHALASVNPCLKESVAGGIAAGAPLPNKNYDAYMENVSDGLEKRRQLQLHVITTLDMASLVELSVETAVRVSERFSDSESLKGKLENATDIHLLLPAVGSSRCILRWLEDRAEEVHTQFRAYLAEFSAKRWPLHGKKLDSVSAESLIPLVELYGKLSLLFVEHYRKGDAPSPSAELRRAFLRFRRVWPYFTSSFVASLQSAAQNLSMDVVVRLCFGLPTGVGGCVEYLRLLFAKTTLLHQGTKCASLLEEELLEPPPTLMRRLDCHR
ncbi:hypothetical protein AGDE_17196 [Angomonas deanei]|uniref:Uncharacterized protein n=1 Tax=Angomonas deanei TaxID=59799 RepID=A0A7G2CQM1_9TRYP|nr:hypothetical protein AGDE_17196 [Angomonas deanei]CAD2221291.1 hypothetical protein, conserved [Angomonas deanei]|eukprot:EPY15067.1 hypothetical protein AGDE_17196 [Angomonas deanei]